VHQLDNKVLELQSCCHTSNSEWSVGHCWLRSAVNKPSQLSRAPAESLQGYGTNATRQKEFYGFLLY